MNKLLKKEPSSFRDPEGFVFIENNKIKRKLLTVAATGRMVQLLESDFYKNEIQQYIVSTEFVNEELVHEKIPIILYPYEWSFNMLKDAAISQLKILESCLRNNFILKDGSAFNMLYNKGRMFFVDILSIDFYEEGQFWEGYHQFCQHFLFPLMLKSYKGINFQNWWRGNFDGLILNDVYALMSLRDVLRPGVFKHVILQKVLSRSLAKEVSIKTQMTSRSYPKNALLSLIKSLTGVVESLVNNDDASIWQGYAGNNSYSANEREQKKKFIEDCLVLHKFEQLIDLGCNTGEYSLIALKFVKRVISADYDADCIDNLYINLSKDPHYSNKIFPTVANLLNLSPSQGWNLEEREGQINRMKSDVFLALALIHHLCIAANIPIELFVLFLRKLAPCGIVEWVDMKDNMVQILLKNRKNVFENYNWETFKYNLEKHFKIDKVLEIGNGKRKLCFVTSL